MSLDAIEGRADDGGVHHGLLLVKLAEALVQDHDALEQARTELCAAAGPATVVEAAGVASNFQRMVRIADGTGISLGERLTSLSRETRGELDLDRYRRY